MAAPSVRLIFCADGNARHARIAHEAGWLYGARLPARGLADLPLYFADQDWRRPDRAAYMRALGLRRPALATVLDWEEADQLPEVLSWAEEAAQAVTDAVLVVPKVPGAIGSIPRRVGGKDVWLAYSVPTRHGASSLGLWEFAGWPVHLLGGSPQRQRDCWSYLSRIAEVRSLDGNMAKRLATSRCCYWTRQMTRYGHWQPIGGAVEAGAPDECLRRSLANVMAWWRGTAVAG